MALSPGTRLGPYEVLSAIGSGGMGDVYKARDTRLDRAVALKVIQPAVAANAEIRERFEREARAISALDHPHICVLYDVCREPAIPGGAGGSSGTSESVSFLVMQYLEGETLADRLARAGRVASDPSRPSSGSDSTFTTVSRGPIPFDTALKFAAEIAHALDAAHRRGIVHRDLKPGNVMLTKAGTKLLDFGLAKLAGSENATGVGGLGEGATRTSPLTSQGAILGTLHYMSPEQLEGRDVDARSDIHAFGAVLFEMLCGRRAFEGQSQAGIIAAIIGADPPSLSSLADARTSLPVVAHRALDRLLARCLAKNPDDRWQSAADLAAELQWIAEERLRAVPESAAAASGASPGTNAGSRRRERTWMAIAAASVVALGGLAYWWYPRPAPPPGPIAFTIEAPAGQTIAPGPGLVSVSPDGTRVAFVTGVAPTQLWVRPVGSLDARRLERADDAWHPVWSPDGRSIAFTASGGPAPLRKVDLATGVITTLAPSASGRAAWSQTGVVLFESTGKLLRVSDTGGSATVAMELDASREEVDLSWPVFLPDGRRYLFNGRSADPSKSGLFLATLDRPERTFLLNVTSSVDYSGGYLFYQRDGNLMAHPFDADAGRLTGDAMTVVENIRYNAANGRGAFSVSLSGVLAFVPGTDIIAAADRRVMLFDRSGKNARQIGAPRRYAGATLSPDGRQAVVAEDSTSQPPVRALSLMDLARGVLTRFTTGSDDERAPVWSPDGSSIVFQSRRAGTYGVYRRSAGGGATKDELLFSSAEPLVPTGFSSDGSLLLMTRGTGPFQRVWVLPVTGDRKPVEAFPGATSAQYAAVFSPDDKWIAYSEGRSLPDSEIYIQPYPADDRRIRISPSSGRHPYWLPDGRHIVYRSSDDALRSVEIRPDGRTFRVLEPVTLFTQPRLSRNNWYYSVDARVEQFLLVVRGEQAEAEAAASPISVIVNFRQGLAKK